MCFLRGLLKEDCFVIRLIESLAATSRQPSSHKGSVLRPTRHLLPYKLFHIVIYINVTHVRELRKLPVHVTVMYDPA